MKKLLIMCFVLSLVGCAVSKTKLSDDGEKVKIISFPGKNCNVIDKVVGINEKGIEQLAHNHARNLAAKLDGNAIVIETVSNGNMIKANGTVYDCRD